MNARFKTFPPLMDEQALAAAPGNYCRVETPQGTRILAHGRDPNFPGWVDTLQLDYANPALQSAQLAELAKIAGQCPLPL